MLVEVLPRVKTQMLLCGLQDVEPGAVLGAIVMDPQTPGHDLLRPGVVLEASLIASLRRRGVVQVWIEDDLTRDLDAAVAPQLTAARLELYTKLRDGLASCASGKLVVASVQTYRQAVLGLVTEAVSSARYASLADSLFGMTDQASHGSNVAYMSLLTALHLEQYIISEQSRLDREHARELSVLGLAGMLHDIGKIRLAPKLAVQHETGCESDGLEAEGYAEHVSLGKAMLENSRAPARVTNAILNHHQRFDGLGWPDMTRYTAGRICGPLRGRRIHVFARIVAAANVLDNLMRDAEGSARPPVAALGLFASEQFNGWFDPVIRRAMLLRIPPFAVGTDVRISDGRRGVVISPAPDTPCRPVVRIMVGAGARGGDAEICDLNARPELSITHALGTDVSGHLYEVPPAVPISSKEAGEDEMPESCAA